MKAKISRAFSSCAFGRFAHCGVTNLTLSGAPQLRRPDRRRGMPKFSGWADRMAAVAIGCVRFVCTTRVHWIYEEHHPECRRNAHRERAPKGGGGEHDPEQSLSGVARPLCRA